MQHNLIAEEGVHVAHLLDAHAGLLAGHINGRDVAKHLACQQVLNLLVLLVQKYLLY